MKIVVDKPILRLFFNVDIIGSTNYKMALSNDDIHSWLPLFREFYQVFPNVLEQSINDKKKEHFYNNVKTEEIKIWKLLGDEIIFYSDLKDSKACGLFVSALKEAINLYQKKYLPEELGLKACAYIAGFPVNNVEIEINGVTDFIGSNIDVGFRLMKYASREKMPISIELAYILTHYSFDLEYFFDGLEILKGVLNNKPYPIFCIDMQNNDDLKDIMPNVQANDVFKFCAEFIKKNDLLEFPFIENDEKRIFTEKPKDYEEKLLQVQKMYGIYKPKEIKTTSKLSDDELNKTLNLMNGIVIGNNNDG